MLKIVLALSNILFGSGSTDQPPSTASIVANGYLQGGMEPFEAEVISFLKLHDISAASFAIANRGKVVLERGYTSDAYPDPALTIDETTLFRVASVSKPITAVAILQLVEKGRLSLEDKVVEVLDLEPLDKRVRDIKVEMLLQHRGGWDRDKSFDPMFKSRSFAEKLGVPAPATSTQVIKAMSDQALDFDPGTRYAYSNYGYCLLGRVIEKVAGKSYEEYVKSHVLDPIGIKRMQIGSSRLEDRADGEAMYEDSGRGKSVFPPDLESEVPSPYGAWHLHAMDSHGGWLASAGDLARFAIALRNDESGLLNHCSLDLMHRRPKGEPVADVYYSLGWQNRVIDQTKVNHWHTGSLPGTTAILIRRHDDKVFAAILNTRQSPVTENLSSKLDNLLHHAASKTLGLDAM